MISPKHPTTYKWSDPRCAFCCVIKSQQYNVRKSTSSPLSKQLSINNTLPGEISLVDQYGSSVKGRLLTSRGKESYKDKRVGEIIFVDAATSFTFVLHQTSLNAADTIRNKLAFKREYRTHAFKDIVLTMKSFSVKIGLTIANVNIKTIYSVELVPVIKMVPLKEKLQLFLDGHDVCFYI